MAQAIVQHAWYASRLTDSLYDIFRLAYANGHVYGDGSTRCMTNGSTKTTVAYYTWGPHFALFEDAIWQSMHRFWHVKQRFYLGEPRLSVPTGPMGDQVCCGCQVFHFNPSKIDPSWWRLRNTAYVTNPVTLKRLAAHGMFVRFVQETASVISITEEDPSGYSFEELAGVPLVNQMRSWHEGVTFYTCPYGEMHFMENLFVCASGSTVDLFNLSRGCCPADENPDCVWPQADTFESCACGTIYRKMNFVPHAVRGFIDSNNILIIPKTISLRFRGLVGRSEFLQLIQQTDPWRLHVHVTPPLSTREKEELVSLCTQYIWRPKGNSRPMEFEYIDLPFRVGARHKQPVFYSMASTIGRPRAALST